SDAPKIFITCTISIASHFTLWMDMKSPRLLGLALVNKLAALLDAAIRKCQLRKEVPKWFDKLLDKYTDRANKFIMSLPDDIPVWENIT
ncbi:hypothetical protein PENTCL1PPCAC_4031, partial [Pristionchus entomophagus]